MVGPHPELIADLGRVLEPAGCRVGGVSTAEFEEVAGLLADDTGRFPPLDCGELIVPLEDVEQFDTKVALAFGGGRSSELAQFLGMVGIRSIPRRPWPRLLIPKGEPAEPDLRTYLGSGVPIPFMRWNLDEVPGLGGLAAFSLYEPDATLIRRIVRGSDRLRLEQALVRSTASSDGERLAELAEAAVMAARHTPGPPEPACSDAIARMCKLRDDDLERAILLAVGHALAVAYEPRWWSIVERIGLDRLCAEAGLKRDRCGQREAALWSRLRRGLTRFDRWYDLSESRTEGGGDLGGSPRPLPTTGEILRQAIDAARGWFPRPFGELSYRQAMPESLASGRPVLVAREVCGGWDVQFLAHGQPPRQASVREETGRLSRILRPLMERMAEDIKRDVAIGECGWLRLGQIDPKCKGKADAKFRRDKSDLIAALAPVGLGIEADKGGRIRLARRLAEERACIEIFVP